MSKQFKNTTASGWQNVS